MPKEQDARLGGAIRKSIVGLQATVANADIQSPLVEIENEEEEEEAEEEEKEEAAVEKTEEKFLTKEESSELGPLEALLKECEQSPENVKTVSDEVKKAKDPNSKKNSLTIEKIGEGTYGEAYMCDNVVLKVVPISYQKKETSANTKRGKENVENGAEEKEGEADYPQMVASEIRAEVAVAKRLTKLQPHCHAKGGKRHGRASSRFPTMSPFARGHTINYSSKRGNLSIFAKFLKTKTRPCGQKISSTSSLARETVASTWKILTFTIAKKRFQYFCKSPWL